MVMQQYEVPLVLQPPDPEQLHPIAPLLQEREAQPTAQWIQHCVELPGQARGWVQIAFPMYHTMLYSMHLAGDSVRQQGTVETDRPHTSKPNHQSRGASSHIGVVSVQPSSWQLIKRCLDGGARHSAHWLSSQI